MQGERTARVQSELGGCGVGGYQVSEMCRQTCEYHVLLVLNEEPKDNLLHPTPLSQAAEMTAVQSKARHETHMAKLQSFPVPLMTSTELSTQKGTELTKHLSQLLFLINLLTS